MKQASISGLTAAMVVNAKPVVSKKVSKTTSGRLALALGESARTVTKMKNSAITNGLHS